MARRTYSNLIDTIYGAGTTTFPINNERNNVTGALTYTNDFSEFQANFTERLKRIARIYDNHPDRGHVMTKVNEIASTHNWQGAYAELCAYDYFNHDILNGNQLLQHVIRANVIRPAAESFALELGKQVADLDGYVQDRPFYFDVKTLKDNVADILEGIYEEVKRRIGVTAIMIGAEHSRDISSSDLERNRNDLLEELVRELNPADKKTFVKSEVIENMNFRITWGRGVNVTEHGYNPVEHALNLHSYVLKYANKFMKHEPSVIVLVNFPWYNQIVRAFNSANTNFYREVSRLVFHSYQNSPALFSSYNPKFRGSQTIHEVTRHLSGLIFLEDNSILSTNPLSTNVKAYIYLNPNAIHSLRASPAFPYLQGLPDAIIH